ncbi:MAG: hypothetical protein J6S91_03275 [Treponema sp.]|nr:hypothetical protein [Treponema sp.]
MNILPEEVAKRLAQDKNAIALINFARGMLQDIEDFNAIDYSEPVEMEIKGKGVMKTYFLR